jgi:primosomal protein N' (replication factor Y)
MTTVRASVAIPRPIRRLFTYEIPPALLDRCRRGVRVVVPFGRSRLTGYLLDLDPRSVESAAPPFPLRQVEEVLDQEPILDEAVLDLTRWAADYYVASWGEMIRAALPGQRARPRTSEIVHLVPAGGAAGPPRGLRQQALLRVLRASPEGIEIARLLRDAGAARSSLRTLIDRGAARIERRERPRVPPELLAAGPPPAPVRLSAAQRSAVDAIGSLLAAGRFAACLLHGVTGSGKTEVYIRAIEGALARGRSALYLVPEIGLTPLLARRLRGRFGEALALLHSGLSDGERLDEWRRIRAGEVKVVLGARSAVFAPLADPGLIVIDEEHDASYKQEESPRYNGRDLAILRGKMSGSVVVLGSATPAMETYRNALRGRYGLLTLPERVGGSRLPTVERVDMRREFAETGREAILSRRLAGAIEERLAKGEQTLVLLNRRGYSTFALCRACGERIECRSCSIAMTLHLRQRLLRCHYCNAQRGVPQDCPRCHAGPLHFGGTGTERLEDRLRGLFPGARIARMDRDAVRGRGAAERILTGVERGEVDILLGTQMISKGHDFPNVTLVGVLAADALLGMPDFRAGERTFQLLSQVAGRSGRREQGGEVIVQAYYIDHHALRAACLHDYEAFAREELEYRRVMHYPPYSAMALVLLRDRRFEKARDAAARAAALLRGRRAGTLQVMGPAPAPLERLRGHYRVQVILKARNRREVQAALAALHEDLEGDPAVVRQMSIDVDPLSTL